MVQPRRAAGRSLRVLTILVLVAGVTLAGAQPRGPGRVTATATLTILAGAVQRVPAGSQAPQPATDGMSLAVGDRVLTRPGATALVTFLDGTTVTVQPGADVTVARADIGKTGSRIGIRLSLGAVWARVVRLADADSGVTLESNTASATVHTGLIGGQQDADGTFVCWTQSPGMTVTDARGERLALEAGQRATLKPGQAAAIQPFRVNRSTLRVAAPPGAVPLVLMPDRARVAGFVAPGIEVNQVFGSATGRAPDGRHALEVPAGLPGPYLLVLEAVRDVEEAVSWAVLYDGAIVFQQAVPLRLAKGARARVTLTVAHDPATAKEPRTARAVGGAARPPAPHEGPLPGRILLAPSEIAAAGGV
jgi:hypothetical protein